MQILHVFFAQKKRQSIGVPLKSENSRHRDACFSKVLVCLFKVQKRLVSFAKWTCHFQIRCKSTAFFLYDQIFLYVIKHICSENALFFHFVSKKG